MNENGPDGAVTLVDVVRVLAETYTDAGVLTWLNARNKHLAARAPRDLVEQGRTADVYAAACRIEGHQ